MNTKAVNMKLQLLLVLAVAVLVPSLSEGRVFSKCELKTILQTAITLPGKIQSYKEDLLAAIICQLNVTSGLNSNLVTVKGIRDSSTTAPTSTPLPTGNCTEPAKPTTNPPTNTTKTTPMPTTTAPITTPPTATTPTNTTAANVTTAGLASPSSSTLSSNRRRRRSSSKSQEKRKPSKSSVKSVFDVLRKCDMQEVEEDDNGERENKRESSESSEEDQQTTVWSLGKYGIFQLTDSYFCNSGYRWSRNICHTACSAFTDDDIRDDIKCFMDSKYLGCFLDLITPFCWDQTKTYFNDCN